MWQRCQTRVRSAIALYKRSGQKRLSTIADSHKRVTGKFTCLWNLFRREPFGKKYEQWTGAVWDAPILCAPFRCLTWLASGNTRSLTTITFEPRTSVLLTKAVLLMFPIRSKRKSVSGVIQFNPINIFLIIYFLSPKAFRD